MDLVLITLSYPYKGGEQTFINQEIPFLTNSFNRLIIVPQYNVGEKVILKNDNIILDEDFSNTKQMISKKSALEEILHYDATIWKIIFQEILQMPSVLINIKKALSMLIYLQNSYYFSLWMDKFIVKNNLDLSKCIFYTYWFQSTTVGLFILKKKYPDIKFISRAHGIDLFEERNRFNYIPFRRQVLKKIDAVYPCMNAGTMYLKIRYNITSPKIKTSYLGVDDYGFVNSSSEDEILRIVSCSSIISIKRLHLIVLGIKEMAKLCPEKKMEWIHFGDGEIKSDVQKLVDEIIDENVSIVLKGHVSLSQIISHYKNCPVDVFINVSSFEGQPVSIKEAISFGIPIIATDVGGNSEIVTKGNGILLSANPSPIDIANAINWFTENQDIVKTMRVNSRRLFLEKYDSSVVYPGFIKMILSD